MLNKANNNDTNLDDGSFSTWLEKIKTDSDMDVPCGSCNACCRSSYFIHIDSTEKATLKVIPKKLLFKTPGASKGNYLLGYDEAGRCPMLVNNQCSIYENRPKTCRNYDCRIFTATGIKLTDRDDIANQALRWRFKINSEDEKKLFKNLQECSEFFIKHLEKFPLEIRTKNETQLAIINLKICDIYFKHVNSKNFNEDNCINEIILFLKDIYT